MQTQASTMSAHQHQAFRQASRKRATWPSKSCCAHLNRERHCISSGRQSLTCARAGAGVQHWRRLRSNAASWVPCTHSTADAALTASVLYFNMLANVYVQHCSTHMASILWWDLSTVAFAAVALTVTPGTASRSFQRGASVVRSGHC